MIPEENPPGPAFPPQDLQQISQFVWRELRSALQLPPHPWRFAHLATTWDGFPHQRILILRDVQQSPPRLVVHTDVRSSKISQIQQQPLVSWLFFDWERKIQLLLRGNASLHTDDAIADRYWARTGVEDRRMYLAPYAPGSVANGPSSNLPAGFPRPLSAAESEHGRAQFAVIVGSVQEMDLLITRPAGNLRASFLLRDGQWEGTWREP